MKTENNVTVAVVESEEKLITDVQSALDFFILSTGLAGESKWRKF